MATKYRLTLTNDEKLQPLVVDEGRNTVKTIPVTFLSGKVDKSTGVYYAAGKLEPGVLRFDTEEYGVVALNTNLPHLNKDEKFEGIRREIDKSLRGAEVTIFYSKNGDLFFNGESANAGEIVPFDLFTKKEREAIGQTGYIEPKKMLDYLKKAPESRDVQELAGNRRIARIKRDSNSQSKGLGA